MKQTSHLQTKELAKGQKETPVHVSSQNPSSWNPPWLSDALATKQHPESEGLARN